MAKKPRKLPKGHTYLSTISVLGKDYHIIEDSNLSQFEGLCYQEEGLIYLKPTDDKNQRLHTLIHELGHAVSYRSGWNQGVSSEIQEVIVESIATMIVETFGELIHLGNKELEDE